MNENEIIEKIMKKKDFSRLPVPDVKLALSKFSDKRYMNEERIKLTRDLLRKVYSAFVSSKILSEKNKDANWILRKHLSTRERLPFYEEVYSRVLKDLPKRISVVDLGAGINGFSYSYFEKLGFNVDYLSIEAVGQLVDLANSYFKREKLNAVSIHISLFEFGRIKKEISKMKKSRVVFLFKVIDSLEMLKRDYSKELLKGIVQMAERVVVSFATRSMIAKKRFFVKRDWIINFIRGNFNVLDDFEIGGERYLVFCKRQSL
jgi:hypothetical protein